MPSDRYQAVGVQAEWQPGSSEQVLRNKLGITSTAAMNEAELQLLLEEAIAVWHVEFILIHPFREGNGRLSRLLADVMAVQSGYGPLDYSAWDANKTAYFAAIQHGLARNYAPMQQWVRSALAAPEA